ncbi:hypothetical protein CYMTET_31476 [Cymbomonas tetramitiformis]|uniref:Uncharacterized protein n=1 Tax=Cymbomonas tetramitiformis TaxID=36881 RepID=A0AAE0FH39_9CHLO|nr:hypothetical protein CYMTET_31476 [Cymbomonas tetramitiformis]
MQDASADTVSVDGGNDTFEDVTDDTTAEPTNGTAGCTESGVGGVETTSILFDNTPTDADGDAQPAAIPPRREVRYLYTQQGFLRHPVVPLPPAL